MTQLSDDELDRYARHIVLPQLGGAGQKRLKSSSVALVGAGGIGAGALPALVGAGVGRITIIDGDSVDLSNLQRQPLYSSADVGKPKAELAHAFAEVRNPHVELSAVNQRLTADNAEELLTGHDLILDGTDNFATRLLVSDAAVRLDIPLAMGAGQQFQGQAALFTGKPCYRCFVGDAFDADNCDTCAELGVLGALTGVMGNYSAMLAIRHLAGVGASESGVLHLFDGLQMRWRAINIAADPACKACA